MKAVFKSDNINKKDNKVLLLLELLILKLLFDLFAEQQIDIEDKIIYFTNYMKDAKVTMG